jgi:hypothetical protein
MNSEKIIAPPVGRMAGRKEIIEMTDELKEKIKRENSYHELLVKAGFYPQGTDRTFRRVIVGVSKVANYRPGIDVLDMKPFESWEEAYKSLVF